ncbi:MAG: glycosyltransferase [Flavobacteriales bacterium]|nr:glycosyltransferase [Flavobacteriales bacterium]
MTTYQHAAFIEQGLESLLSQKTNFKVEILVGEDDSTDGTREICQRIAKNNPDRVRLVLRERKDVMYIGGKPQDVPTYWIYLVAQKESTLLYAKVMITGSIR